MSQSWQNACLHNVQVKQLGTCTAGAYILWHHFRFKHYRYGSLGYNIKILIGNHLL